MQRSGQILVAAAIVTALGGGIALVAVKRSSTNAASSATASSTRNATEGALLMPLMTMRPTELPSNRDVGAALLRAGLHPRMLAAAGVSSESITAMFAAVQQAEGNPCAALLAAGESLGSARAEVQRLARLASSGLASQNDLTALTAATTTLSNATTARDTYAATIRGLATRQLSQPCQTALTTARSHADLNLPCTYAPTVTTEADALALRRALAAARTAARWGEETPSQAATLIASANVAASSTAAALNAHAASVMLAWNNAVE